MFIVTTWNKALPRTAPGAVTIDQYRHPYAGEPALNRNTYMTAAAGFMFKALLECKSHLGIDVNEQRAIECEITGEDHVGR